MSDGCQNRDRGQEPPKPWLSRVLKDAKKSVAKRNQGISPTIYLFQKWAFKVERGWYGFDLEGVPFEWANKIDEFLTWTNDHIPEFKIRQIKLKFGRVVVYLDLGLPDNLIQDRILLEYREKLDVLQATCWDERLIY